MQYIKLDDQTMNILDDDGVLIQNESFEGNKTRLESISSALLDAQSALIAIESDKLDVEELLAHFIECGFLI